MSEFTYRGSKNVSFIVKNNSNKKIRIFNYPLWPGQTRDLLQIPAIGEEDIRASLLKGQLQFMISIGQISIVSSDIELIQFNIDQQTFLQNAGASNGLASDVRTAAQKTADAATANWFVSATGTTTGTGTSIGDPITPAELSRRLNGLTLTVIGDMLVTFDSAGDPTHNFVVTWNIPSGCQTRLKGTPISVLTGTVTTVRASSPASQIEYGITDSALPAANSWTAQVGRRFRNTTVGARLNTVAWIAKDEGAKVARISPPSKCATAYPFNSANYVNTPIVTNDTYMIETLPIIGGLSRIGFQDNDGNLDGDYQPKVILEDIGFSTFAIVYCDATAPVSFVNCLLPYVVCDSGGTSSTTGCNATAFIGYGGNFIIQGCLFTSGGVTLNSGSTINMSNVLLQGPGAYFSCSGQSYVYVQSGDTAVFDSATQAVLLNGGSNWKVTGGSYLFGNGNTYGIILNDLSQLHWAAQKPNIAGTTSDVQVDGINIAWTATPYIDRYTGSALYVSGTGGGRPQNIQAFPIAGSASSVAEGAIGYLAGIGTITKVIFLPNATSTPASGSNSQAMVVGIGNGAGGARSQVAAASIANATQATAFSNFDMGTITNGSFTDGQILTFKTTLTGTATLPAGMLFVVIK